MRKQTHPSTSSSHCKKLDKEDKNIQITTNYNRLTEAGEEEGVDRWWCRRGRVISTPGRYDLG